MLARIDQASADIAAVETQIEELITPFAGAVERLDEIPGVGVTAVHVMFAEVGLDMTRFPTAAHLCSWARFAPGIRESAGKKKGRGTTGHGNPYLAAALGGPPSPPRGPTPSSASATAASLAAAARRRRSSLSAAPSWSSSGTCCPTPEARFHDLGPDFYDTRVGLDRKKRNHVRQLEALGYKITLEPVA